MMEKEQAQIQDTLKTLTDQTIAAHRSDEATANYERALKTARIRNVLRARSLARDEALLST